MEYYRDIAQSESEELLSKLERDNQFHDVPQETALAAEAEKQVQTEIEEVDDDDSPPQKSFQPIEVVVCHNKVVEQEKSDSDDDDEVEREPRERKRSRTVVREDHPCLSSVPFSKKSRGYARSWSMLNEKERTLRAQNEIWPAHGDPITTSEASDANSRAEQLDMTSLNPENDDTELGVDMNEHELAQPIEEERNGRRRFLKRFWGTRWKTTTFEGLPRWLQDNEYLKTGCRPPIPSFVNCWKSVFDIHTETGNIITHMHGCLAFIGIAIWFLTRPDYQVQIPEKLIFSAFFLGVVSCLGMSFTFHVMSCHSDSIGRLFSKLDYTGITLLIVGSFIPWIYYAFNCRPQPMVIYLSMISLLGVAAIIVSLCDKFATPKFRPARAGVFVAMGLSAVVPAAHLLVVDGLDYMIYKCSMYWMILMGGLYIGGAALYAARIPERCFPGRCDFLFQSHQLFHLCVVAAAFVHFHAITKMAMQKLMEGSCSEQLLKRYGSDQPSSWLRNLLGIGENPSTASWSPDLFVS